MPSSAVIFLALGGAIFLRERLSAWSVVALFVGVSGPITVGIAGQSSNPETAGQYVTILGFNVSAGLVGALAFLGVGMSGAIYGLLMRRLKSEVDTVALTLGQMTTASSLSVLVLILTQTGISARLFDVVRLGANSTHHGAPEIKKQLTVFHAARAG